MRRLIAVLALSLTGVAGVASDAQAGGTRVGFSACRTPSFGYGRSFSRFGNRYRGFQRIRRHVHSFRNFAHRVWVPPVYRSVVIGYDRCGAALYDRRLVKAGYYRNVRYRGCGCGHKVYY